ncbi:hypothetical protein [Pontibacter aydingkolensis]
MNSPRSLRTTELVKELANEGHDITVITPKNNIAHSIFEKEYNVHIKDLGQSQWKPVAVKGGEVEVKVRRVFKRLSDLLFQYPNSEFIFSVKKALEQERGYDLLISIAAPHTVHWGVAWAWKEQDPIAKIWVADCGDPFMGLKNDTFKKPFYFKYIEKWFMRKTHFVAVPIEEALSAYYPEFRHKIKIIPQGFSFPNIAEYKENKIVTFIYSGSVGPYMHYAVHFFNFLKGINRDFKFIIYTKEKDIYQKELSGIKDKIEVRGYVPREELLLELAKADFLVHYPYKDNTQQSLKLIDYFYSQRPIISYEGEKDNVKLSNFFNKNYEQRLEPKNIDIYKIKNVCKSFLELAP